MVGKGNAMSEYPARSDHILSLLSQKAVHQIVRMLASRGPMSFAAVATHTAKAAWLLRSLAAEGFVRRNGSWDMRPNPDTTIELTERGQDLVAQLDRLDEWARGRDHNRRNSP